MRNSLATLVAAGLALASPLAASAQTGAAPPPANTTAPATTSAPAASAGAAGVNAQATTANDSVTVGEPVKDNTGATIGEITSLSTSAGQPTAVIKMGTDTFQVPTDRLGAAAGTATINMTQSQIEKMLHPQAGGR